ncbi:chromatin assembly factor 1 subunit A-domain-containing protein [Fennellomyces sp. T-0311]|nr:chromatin assembly factor 1 subunit A-domain-containing protein [Fennellomyces sp. T-0311]
MSEENFNRLQISMKLLQFTEDVRPAYYGTWTKSSKRINARCPLAKDEGLVDYEHDSEGEWEPEGEGEEIQSGDEDEDDPSSDIADPEDAGWLVPEGYLSEGEGVESDEERTTKVASGPSMRPTRKHMAIRPVIIGPIFDDGQATEDDTLRLYPTRMLFDYANERPYDPFKMDTEDTPNTKLTSSTGDDNSKKMTFTPEHESELINIIKGKADAMPKLVSEAKANWLLRDVSKRQIEMKIKDLAVKEKRGSDTVR